MKLAEKALILGSPSEMLVDYNSNNYDSMNIMVNYSSDDFAAIIKLQKLTKKLRAQSLVSSNISVDENIELINSSLS
jgi:N-acetylmuramoyl-L-alanine amidase CwlA